MGLTGFISGLAGCFRFCVQCSIGSAFFSETALIPVQMAAQLKAISLFTR
jgi:hypothetical protein